VSCECQRPDHEPRLVVLTGGPGAGKTAVLEVVRRSLCRHVKVLPEAAGILFSGGFPRHHTLPGHRAAQRAIFQVQRQLEWLAIEEHDAALILCDRGCVDGFAYWPPPREEFWAEMGTTHAAELARYAAVIHLRTPASGNGYDHSNPLRIESAEEAAAIDQLIASLWAPHPRRREVASTAHFPAKLAEAIALIRAEVPGCCLPSAGALTGPRRSAAGW